MSDLAIRRLSSFLSLRSFNEGNPTSMSSPSFSEAFDRVSSARPIVLFSSCRVVRSFMDVDQMTSEKDARYPTVDK